MKRMLVISVCLFLLTGLVFGQGFKFKLVGKNSSYETELHEPAFITSYDWSNGTDGYRSGFRLDKFKGQETTNQVYLEGQYSPLPWIELRALIGISRIDSWLNEPTTSWVNSYESITTYESPSYQRDSVSSKGKVGLLAGFGLNTVVWQNNSSSINFSADYLYQSCYTRIVLREDSGSYDYLGEYGNVFSAYEEESVVNRIKAQELTLSVFLTKKIKDTEISTGLRSTTMWSEYQGKFTYDWFVVNYGRHEWDNENHLKEDVNLDVRNKKFVSGFVRAEYSLNEKTKIVVEVMAGARNQISGGFVFSLF